MTEDDEKAFDKYVRTLKKINETIEEIRPLGIDKQYTFLMTLVSRLYYAMEMSTSDKHKVYEEFFAHVEIHRLAGATRKTEVTQ